MKQEAGFVPLFIIFSSTLMRRCFMRDRINIVIDAFIGLVIGPWWIAGAGVTAFLQNKR